MAKQVLNNGESGLIIRGKINDNFTELYTGKDSVTVANFAALPAPASASGEKWWCLASQGVYLVNRKPAGSYYSDGVAWTWLGDNPTTADQVGNVPAGGISATDVQAALNGLDTGKLNIAGTAVSATQLATGRTIAITGDLAYTSPSFNGTGNVTAAGTIANDAVSFAKMQNSTAASILIGRGAGSGAGDFQEIVLGTNLSMTGTVLNATGGGGGGSPGGSTTQVQYNNAGAFDGAANVTIDATEHLITGEYQELIDAAANPTAPTTGNSRLFGKNIAQQRFLSVKGPLGDYHTLQPNIGRNSVSLWAPIGNSTTVGTGGAAGALTAVGTATAATMAATNAHTMMKRVEWLVTVAAATAVAGFRYTSQVWSRSALANYGGFKFVCRWGPATGATVATARAFTGFRNQTAAPTDVEPSTQINVIGMGWDAADTNIQIMHNDGTGTCTKVDLGASFPVPSADRTNVYELTMFCCPTDTSRVDWQVENLSTFAVATGSITTDLPATTAFLAPAGWCSVGGTSSVIGYALMQLYIESEL